MNACLECCGLSRFQGAAPANHETFRLLHDDPNRSQYGTSPHDYTRVIQSQPDPEVLRREREEMESICQNMSNQLIDVFNVAPSENNRTLTIAQAKAMLIRNGITISKISESKILAFAQQSTAGQARAIQAYHDNANRDPHSQYDGSDGTQEDEVVVEVQPPRHGIKRDSWSATDEELIYKSIKRPKRDPVSIELGPNESQAAKAAIG